MGDATGLSRTALLCCASYSYSCLAADVLSQAIYCFQLSFLNFEGDYSPNLLGDVDRAFK